MNTTDYREDPVQMYCAECKRPRPVRPPHGRCAECGYLIPELYDAYYVSDLDTRTRHMFAVVDAVGAAHLYNCSTAPHRLAFVTCEGLACGCPSDVVTSALGDGGEQCSSCGTTWISYHRRTASE